MKVFLGRAINRVVLSRSCEIHHKCHISKESYTRKRMSIFDRNSFTIKTCYRSLCKMEDFEYDKFHGYKVGIKFENYQPTTKLMHLNPYYKYRWCKKCLQELEKREGNIDNLLLELPKELQEESFPF